MNEKNAVPAVRHKLKVNRDGKRILRILVYLGVGMTWRIHDWSKASEAVRENTMPYGYDKVAGTLPDGTEVRIDYLQVSETMEKLLPKYRLKKWYLEWFRVPLALYSHDAVWTHFDDDTLHLGRLKSVLPFRDRIARCVGQLIWLMDRSSEMTKEEREAASEKLRHVETVIVQNHFSRSVVTDAFGVPSQRVRHAAYGINLKAYEPDRSMRRPARGEGLEPGYIFFSGTDRDRDMALFKQLVEQLPDRMFVMATRNEALLHAAYPPNVRTVSASYPEMLWLYRHCGCVIVPLVYNVHASGLTTLMECAGMRRTVVISDVPGMRDYTDDGQTAKLVPIADLTAFRNAVEEVLAGGPAIEAMQVRAHALVKEKFLDIHYAGRCLDATLAIYNE